MDDAITRILRDLSGQTFAALQQDLAQAATLPALLAITQASLQHTEKTVTAIRDGAAVETVCAAGCSFCCWLRIDATAHEVLLIARYLRYHWTKGQVAALLATAQHHRDAEASMNYAARQRIHRPCLLLKDGLCQVYDVRPMACRRYFSGSLNACHQLWQDPEAEAAVQSPLLDQAGRAATTAVNRAFFEAGYDAAHYDLTAALAEALEDPGCEERWARKISAFSASARTRVPG